MKRIIYLLIVVIAVAGVYYSMRRPPGPLILTGIVTTQEVIVGPQVGGQIGQLLVKEGDRVERNQLIAVMATGELQADREYYSRQVESAQSQVGENQAALRYEQRQTEDQIQQARAAMDAAIAQTGEAKAELENARITLDRSQKLVQQGVSPVQQLDQARTAYDGAKARLEAAEKQVEVQRAAVAVANANAEQVAVQQNRIRTTEKQTEAAAAQRKRADVRLSYSEVRAPVDGVVDIRAAREGEVVNSGQPIITLIDPDDLWVRADIEETYIERIRIGDQLKVRLPSGDERMGVVFYRATDASFATQRDVSRTKRDIKTFEIRLRIDNKDRRLAVGMTTYIELPVT
jgi:multidrug resistance efflux pump